jgi:hypothetical protein
MNTAERALHGPPGRRAANRDEDLTHIPDALWRIGRRRLQILSPLVRVQRRAHADVDEAAEQLGCSRAWTYALLKRLEADSRVTSLVPQRTGPRLGQYKLAGECRM